MPTHTDEIERVRAEILRKMEKLEREEIDDIERKEVIGPDEAPTSLESREDVRAALATNIRKMQAGTVTPSVGHCVSIALGSLCKMFDTEEEKQLKRRIKALEDRQAKGEH